MIEIKDPSVCLGMLLWQYHHKLCQVFNWLLHRYSNVTFTETYRPKQHANDLHGTIPVRAIDIRSWNYPDPLQIQADINKKWEYDPARPDMMCCVYHGKGKEKHFHIQVHKRTRMRG